MENLRKLKLHILMYSEVYTKILKQKCPSKMFTPKNFE